SAAPAGGGSAISDRLLNDPDEVSGLRESKEATARGLSGRSRKVEFAGTAKSAWKSKSRSASERSPTKASSVKTEKTLGAPAGGGVRPLKSDGIMPEEALLSSGPSLK